ncbi:(DL)-glycerol-3-phosphatase 2 [Micractinium conductrix]|uniref:glycerol-1-phosphatase n=1 Tax=Micractinium conductrix TaxID=554055 RepID=A0A2P6VIY2_9CHLO|nr:(DL)-glycerol-3-phosphatase 2 [Micractinium conductrix]|eukprot:PSC74063.1 (DL)-glycerol-3-phosphatase 2 [Micractinium conductrix]
MAALGKISHVLFDMDGLLLDTETFYTVVQQRLVARFGKTFTWDLKAKIMGKKAIEAARTLVSELDLEGKITPEQVLIEREEALDEMFPTAELLPGAERLLRHLAACGVPIALATSSHLRHYTLKTTQHGELFSLFNHRVTGDQISNGKPAPDIFLAAAGQWEPAPDPSACLVFEDAPSGVAAAKAAGMWCAMVPDSQLDPALHAGADQVLTSLEGFDPLQWGLPPFPVEGAAAAPAANGAAA